MTDQEIYKRLSAVGAIHTLTLDVDNEVVQVGQRSVIVRSKRTLNDREIPFDHIRRAATITTNGCVVRALARVLGLY